MELSSTTPGFALNQTRIEQASIHDLQTKADRSGNPKDLKEAAQGFEAVFLGQLLNAMDKTVDRSGFMSGGSAEETFRGMMYQEVAKDLAASNGGNGFGLGQKIYEQMAMQENSQSVRQVGG